GRKVFTQMPAYTQSNSASTSAQANWAELLRRAVAEPGLINRAYSAFHNYSVGNQLLALVQCEERGLQPGPIATYQRWQEQGRQVRRGERALWLCMPLKCKRRNEATDEAQEFITAFVYRPRWFVLAQTEGEELPSLSLPDWDKARALAALDIT